MSNDLDWLLRPNEEVWQEEADKADARGFAKFGGRCPVCGYRVRDPRVLILDPDHPAPPGITPHDCYTGDPLAR